MSRRMTFPKTGVGKAQARAIDEAWTYLAVAARMELRYRDNQTAARAYAKAARELLAAFTERMTIDAWVKRDTDRFMARLENPPRRQRRKKRKARA